MKKTIFAILMAVLLSGAISCEKETPEPPLPPRELSVPEKLEAELLDIAQKDWKSLLDTAFYFYDNILSKGETEGKGPDGVYYRLRILHPEETSLEIDFIVQDSTFVKAEGKVKPLSIQASALGAIFTLSRDEDGNFFIEYADIRVAVPAIPSSGQDNVLVFFEGKKVGFITVEKLENENHNVRRSLILHYYDDPRTFAFYN